jgi:hypothetical protein
MLSDTQADFAACLISPKATDTDLLRATRLWGAGEAIREINGYLWSPADRERIECWTEKARSRVVDLEWNLAWISGRSMSLAEALKYALTPEKVPVSRS